MRMLSLVLALLLTISNLFSPPVIMAQSGQRIPDEYAPRLPLFEEFVKGQMEKDRIPGLTIGFTTALGITRWGSW